MSQKPVLVLGFDGTLTALPVFWREVVSLARLYGQRVICLTQRREEEESIDEVDEWFEENKITLPVFTLAVDRKPTG